MHGRFWYIGLGYLVVLGGLSLVNCGCNTHDIHPATTFVFRNQKVISEPGTSTIPARPETAKAQAQPPASSGRVRLTLYDAIADALQHNQKIQVSSFNPPQAVQDLKSAQAVYDSSLFSSGNIGRVKRPTNSLLDTGDLQENVLIEKRRFLQTGAKKLLPTGATVSIYQEMDSLDSNSLFVVPNPQGTSRLVMELSQPLLKGWWDRSNRAAITIARLTVDISKEEFLKTVMDVVTNVVKTYWQLVQEREFEFIAQRTLAMAQEVSRREHVRLERGLSARLDADRALTAEQLRRSELLKSQARIKKISDQLRLLLNLPETSLKFIPVDKPLTRPVTVEMDKAVAAALKNRPELQRAQTAIGVSQTRKELANHNLLPKLNAVLRLTKNGLGASPGTAVDTVYTENNNSWLTALEFEYPLGNQAAKAEYTKRSLEYDQSRTEAWRVKDQVINEVSLAIREINLANRDIPTTLQAQTAAKRVVAEETARFELGQKSNEELLRAQDLWAVAARNYAQAVIDYNNALTSLERAKGTILQKLGIKIEK